MSIQAIEAALKKAREECDGFSWVDEEYANLLMEIGDYLVRKEKPNPQGIPQGFINLKEFEKKHQFVSRETLRDYCRSLEWAILVNDIWWIHEKKTLDFLLSKPIFKKRMQRLGKI